MVQRFYTGIGSRRTPPDILDEMSLWANILAKRGWILRSGGSPGADLAFEDGCDLANGLKEIYLPWKGFNGSKSERYTVGPKAMEMGEHFYGSRWKYLKQPVKQLQARNVYQIFGVELEDSEIKVKDEDFLILEQQSEFVICWTPDGCTSRDKRGKETGGTGQAIAIASEFAIPIFNLQKPMESQLLYEYLENDWSKVNEKRT